MKYVTLSYGENPDPLSSRWSKKKMKMVNIPTPPKQLTNKLDNMELVVTLNTNFGNHYQF